MPNDTWPDWEQVLSAAARLQRILPEVILVGEPPRRYMLSIACRRMPIMSCPTSGSSSTRCLPIWSRWQNWQAVKAACAGDALLIFDRIVGLDG